MLRRHQSCSDLAMKVLKGFFIKEKRAYSFKVHWHCMKPSGPQPMYVGGMPFHQRLKIPLETWSKDWTTIILKEGETWRDYYFENIKGPCARESAERFEAFQSLANSAKRAPENEPRLCSVWQPEEGGSAPQGSISQGGQ